MISELLIIFLLLCAVAIIFVFVSHPKGGYEEPPLDSRYVPKADYYRNKNDLYNLFQEYRKWNLLIENKNDMKAFYAHLTETLESMNIKFKINITYDEFNRVTVKMLKEFNEEALKETLKDLDAKRSKFIC